MSYVNGLGLELFFFFCQKTDARHQTIRLKLKKEYNKEKGDYTKTFSKGRESKVGHTQPVPNVLSSNGVR